jgi:NitT/TauT family transport system ATP-binding protein
LDPEPRANEGGGPDPKAPMPLTSPLASVPLLQVDGVTLQYKTPHTLVTATYRVDFSVHRSDRYVVLGPSGCGKSTLLMGVGG